MSGGSKLPWFKIPYSVRINLSNYPVTVVRAILPITISILYAILSNGSKL